LRHRYAPSCRRYGSSPSRNACSALMRLTSGMCETFSRPVSLHLNEDVTPRKNTLWCCRVPFFVNVHAPLARCATARVETPLSQPVTGLTGADSEFTQRARCSVPLPRMQSAYIAIAAARDEKPLSRTGKSSTEADVMKPGTRLLSGGPAFSFRETQLAQIALLRPGWCETSSGSANPQETYEYTPRPNTLWC